jgi:hypothetical protein
MAVAWICLRGWFQSAGRRRATRHASVARVAALLVGEVGSVFCDEPVSIRSTGTSQANENMPPGADRAALLFRVFGQEARFSGGLTGVSI